MKKKIIKDLLGDALVAIIASEGLWFGLKYLCTNVLKEEVFQELQSFVNGKYWLIAIGMFLMWIAYYALCGLVCVKRCERLLKEDEISDAELCEHYKESNKCCQYRVGSGYLFVNTMHGIVCMRMSDIKDKKYRTVHHTRKQTYKTSAGYTRRVNHSNDYYTYHFKLVTKYGTFKNKVANHSVLEELQYLFS